MYARRGREARRCGPLTDIIDSETGRQSSRGVRTARVAHQGPDTCRYRTRAYGEYEYEEGEVLDEKDDDCDHYEEPTPPVQRTPQSKRKVYAAQEEGARCGGHARAPVLPADVPNDFDVWRYADEPSRPSGVHVHLR